MRSAAWRSVAATVMDGRAYSWGGSSLGRELPGEWEEEKASVVYTPQLPV